MGMRRKPHESCNPDASAAILLPRGKRRQIMVRHITVLLLILFPIIARAENAPVTLTEDDNAYTLANGIVTAKVSKANGDLISLVYKDIETLTDKSGHAGGYWSHDARADEQLKGVTIDPKTNNGERG